MKLLFVDIETAPNTVHTWGLWQQNIGTNQIMASGYTMCWSAKWQGEKKVMFDSIHKSGEKEMLERIYDLLDEADAVAHYNGRKFDMPTLNKEFIKMGFVPPSPYKEIDLLETAKRKFRFPSNKLDYIAQTLGLGKKVKHMGHDLWVRCMAGDEAAWKIMERYNKQDVKLLESLYDTMLPWIDKHPNHGLYVDDNKPVCRNCGSEHITQRGFSMTTLGKYQRYQCQSCGTWGRGKKMVQGVEIR